MNDKKRLEVIECSILIERAVATTLASLLDIDIDESKTLGNKSSSFSFKQKLDLLTDIKVLDKSAIKKFQIFTEIRNQFAHNFDVNDFSSCFAMLDGAEKFLRKNYSLDSSEASTHEEELSKVYSFLFSDILSNTAVIINRVEKRYLRLLNEKEKAKVPGEIIYMLDEYISVNKRSAKKLKTLIIDIKKKFEL
ncbi:hypothetical protein BH10BAC3_BH10BAC3_09190 [soil metagenome]